MQDGRKKPKKEKITREEVARKLKEEHGIELSDPEDTLQKAWESLNPDHAEKTKDILDAQRPGSQNVGLEGYSISISRHHLHNGLDSHLLQMDARRDAGHANYRSLIVGDVDRVGAIFQELSLFNNYGSVSAARRAAFGGYCEIALRQYFLKSAFFSICGHTI